MTLDYPHNCPIKEDHRFKCVVGNEIVEKERCKLASGEDIGYLDCPAFSKWFWGRASWVASQNLKKNSGL